MPHSVHTTPGAATPEPSAPKAAEIRYWNVNMPESEWTTECPDFLLDRDRRDIEILLTPETEYYDMSWERVKEVVVTNRLDLFERRPLALRAYFAYIASLKRTHGTVLSYIQHHRLHWDNITPRSTTPFAEASDWKILRNDWPYGIDGDIAHLVVWTKFEFEEDAGTADLTERARGVVEGFVRGIFCEGGEGVERGRVVWFKNWAALKSVRALEHFHVMIYKAPPEFLDRITGGDRAVSETLGR